MSHENCVDARLSHEWPHLGRSTEDVYVDSLHLDSRLLN